MVARSKKLVVLAAGALIAITIHTYFFVQSILRGGATGGIAQADTCVDPSAERHGNPNAMLFISCGGFIE